MIEKIESGLASATTEMAAGETLSVLSSLFSPVG